MIDDQTADIISACDHYHRVDYDDDDYDAVDDDNDDHYPHAIDDQTADIISACSLPSKPIASIACRTCNIVAGYNHNNQCISRC